MKKILSSRNIIFNKWNIKMLYLDEHKIFFFAFNDCYEYV